MGCKICGNTEGNKHYSVPEMMFGLKDTFNYLECSKCECLQLSDEIPDISKYYPENYYSYSNTSSKSRFAQVLIRLRDKSAIFDTGIIGKQLNKRKPNKTLELLRNIPLNYQSKILDVGCGDGIHLKELLGAGFVHLTGADPYIKEDILIGEKQTIFKKELREMDGTYDLIMFHHSFEHMPNPQDILIEAAKRLSSGGTCLIRIPTASSYAWKHYRENWVQLDAPRHYFLHTKESMAILASKAGLTVENCIYDSDAFQFWGSEQYLADIPLMDAKSHAKHPEKSMFTSAKIDDFTKQAHVLNTQEQGDMCAYFLKKA